MKHIFFRTFNTFIALVLVLSMFASGIPAAAQAPSSDPLQILASAKGADAKDLSLLDSTPFTLLDGRQVLRIKARNVKTGETIGGDFENGMPVDLASMQAAAGKAWRDAHGALTPKTLELLAAYAPGDRMNISVWLAGDIQSLPRAEFNSSALTLSGTTAAAAGSSGGLVSQPLTVRLGNKEIVLPLAEAQIPNFVRTAMFSSGGANAPLSQRSAEEEAAGLQAQADAIPAADADGKIEEFKQTNQKYLEAQVAPLQSALAGRLQNLGLKAAYASPLVPTAYLENVSRAEIEQMAFWPEIDAIYIVPAQAGPSLDNANPAQNANIVNGVGYNGTGVAVAVCEGERAFFGNPALILRNMYDGGQPSANHPTAVSGFIKSTASGYTGLANGATVDSANGSYSNFGTMSAAIDWASTNNTVINNSWYWDYANSPTFWTPDRHLDYLVRYGYDFVAVAAGNFGNGCGGYTNYVVSPAKGFNVMSVGSYEDQNNIGWSDDAMDYCSSYVDPGSDTAFPTHAKPEVAAIGATMHSTLPNAVEPLIGNVGSGTSYASPMVAALAADLIQAQPSLATLPESLRAIIMATAIHNIEGSADLSDVDGTGGVDFTAALATAERGQFNSQYVSSSTVYPLTYYMTAHKGERVRFVATWLSNPDGAYTADSLPADIDLEAYRADGTTLMDGSYSGANSFEIVDFIAPETESYIFKVYPYAGSFPGGGTWLGTAGWRGEYRISPMSLYTDPQATPLGTHLAIYPSDWTRSNYWRVLSTRSIDSDHDLELYSASQFDDPSTRANLAGSVSGLSIDLIAVDGNHRSAALGEHYWVKLFSGSPTAAYDVAWSNNSGVINPGVSGPFTRGGALPAEIYDLWLEPGLWRVRVIPNMPTNTVNLGAFLYVSQAGIPSTWTQGKWGAAVFSDSSTAAGDTESFVFTAPASDYYGLAIISSTRGTSSYYLDVQRLSFLPAIIR
jgi:hypothetical protein